MSVCLLCAGSKSAAKLPNVRNLNSQSNAIYEARARASHSVWGVCISLWSPIECARSQHAARSLLCVFFFSRWRHYRTNIFYTQTKIIALFAPNYECFFFLHSFIRFRSFIWCVECNNAQRLLIALLIILITHSEEFLISRLEFHNTKIH